MPGMSSDADVLPSADLLDFQLFDWLRSDRDQDRETLLAIFETARRLAADAFMPVYRKGDTHEPWLDAEGAHMIPETRDALARYANLGMFGVSFPEALGGLGMPFASALAVQAHFGAANSPITGLTVLTIANARLVAEFGTPAQVNEFAVPQIAGRWFGTMCLSEPQAGSSLSDIRTRAVPDGEGALGRRYRLFGNKMWITGGDQDASENIVHLVLAKVARADGTLPGGSAGISLFIVPKILPDGSRNDVVVAGLNHKLGNRAATNCLLNFGEDAGAIGWLVGAEGDGLKQMFMMMNEARISVGMGAAALGYRGYRQAFRYAQERVQGRSVASSGTGAVPIIEHPDVRRMLLQQKTYAEGAFALVFYCANLLDLDTEEARELLALLTPVAKSWPSEFCVIANDLAIQIHGGYGYTRDFDVELLWRDNRLNPIHEGTTGIQAIDLLARKLLNSDGKALRLLRDAIADTARRSGPDFAGEAASLVEFWDGLTIIVDGLRDQGSGALDDATFFLRAFGHGVVAWLWLDQVLAAATLEPTPFRNSVGYACRYFFETELPQAATWLSVVGRHSGLVRDLPLEAFA